MAKSLETIVIKEPAAIAKILENKFVPNSRQDKEQKEIERLIAKFDKMPFTEKCSGKNCSQIATYFTVYRGTISLRLWCDTCDPYQSGASQRSIEVLKSYSQAISYAEGDIHRKSDYKRLFLYMFKAKGLKGSVTEKNAVAFFQ